MELTIDCRACTRRHTESCDGCIVSFLVSREPDEAIVIDAAEFGAMRRLAAAGLIESPLEGFARRPKCGWRHAG
jgi:hypothetical protein